MRGLRRLALSWWHGLPAPLQSRAWPTAIACLTILALLLGFHEVVTMSVRQGELLRMTAATESQALWRCHALRNAQTRASCLEQLRSPPRTEEASGTSPPPNTAMLAQLGR
jgi:hypothetical protein